MNARIYEFPENKKWQECYKAAIVEADSTKLPDRIAEAKKVIGQRARELFQTTGNNFEEEQALDVAICVLHALSWHVEVPTDYSAANPQRSENRHELTHLKTN
jgi:hypothetical protein